MNCLMSWLKKSHKRTPPSPPPMVVEENQALRAELAQTVITFERRRHNVHQIAEQALHRMKGPRG